MEPEVAELETNNRNTDTASSSDKPRNSENSNILLTAIGYLDDMQMTLTEFRETIHDSCNIKQETRKEKIIKKPETNKICSDISRATTDALKYWKDKSLQNSNGSYQSDRDSNSNCLENTSLEVQTEMEFKACVNVLKKEHKLNIVQAEEAVIAENVTQNNQYGLDEKQMKDFVEKEVVDAAEDVIQNLEKFKREFKTEIDSKQCELMEEFKNVNCILNMSDIKNEQYTTVLTKKIDYLQRRLLRALLELKTRNKQNMDAITASKIREKEQMTEMQLQFKSKETKMLQEIQNLKDEHKITLDNLQKRINEQDQMLKKKSDVIAALSKENEDSEERINEQKDMLKKKSDDIEALSKENTDNRKRIIEQKDMFKKKRDDIAKLSKENTDTRKRHAGKETMIQTHISDEQLFCDQCQLRGRVARATHYCLECQEMSCASCTLFHQAVKITKNHALAACTFQRKMCKLCEVKKSRNTNAMVVCKNCEEFFCDDCRKFHISQKHNKDHKIISIYRKSIVGTK